MATVPTSAAAAREFVKGNVHPNGVAVLTLDRPEALNCFNADMVERYSNYIDAWEKDPLVKCVLVQSSSPRAFSAGGDLKRILSEGTLTYVMKFFKTGTSLLCKIREFKKPYICLMDGITMGFGLGASAHGRYRVVSERTILAMPENKVGLFPDAGFTYIAASSPGGGSTGLYMGMTGKHIKNPADALYLGLGTHYVPSGDLNSLKEALLAATFSHDPHQDVDTMLTKFTCQAELKPQMKSLLLQISSIFKTDKSITKIIEELKLHSHSFDNLVAEWAKEALANLTKGAPFSLYLTQKHFSKVASAVANQLPYNQLSTFKEVMQIEYKLNLVCLMRNDFREGVQALMVNKNQNLRWNPPTLDKVDAKEIESLLRPTMVDLKSFL